MRQLVVMLSLLLSPLTAAEAQVSIQFGLPSVSIGFSQPVYPHLVAVPGYPVYYDPDSASNYFFYDGMYWVYAGDEWYASDWYDGPWGLVAPESVPLFVLRVPVSYYRHPPVYFRDWRPDAPPRWGEHWGDDWERRHGGWDRWDRQTAPAAAPLPTYQRQYSGNRYPAPAQQRELHGQNYRREPRDAAVRQVYQAQVRHEAPPARPESHAQPAQRPQLPAALQPSGHTGDAPQPARPQPPAEPARPAPHAQPMQHPQPVQPAEHAQPAQPARHEQPVQPAQHAQPAQPIPPAQRPPPVQPVRHEQPVQPAQHAQPVQPAQPAQGKDRARPEQRGQKDSEREGGGQRDEERGQDHRR